MLQGYPLPLRCGDKGGDRRTRIGEGGGGSGIVTGTGLLQTLFQQLLLFLQVLQDFQILGFRIGCNGVNNGKRQCS